MRRTPDLSAIGQILSDTCRKADLTGRYGGDGFTVLCQAKDPDSFPYFCERIRRSVESGSKKLTGHRFTVSLGGVTAEAISADHQFLLQMIALADANLAKVKVSGKNGCLLT